MNFMTRSIQVSLFLFAGTLLGSCGQTFNTNTTDYLLLPSNYCADQSMTALCEANEIIQTKCTNCHTSTIHAGWGAYNTNEAWLESGKVIAGNPEGSTLVDYLAGFGTIGTMPKDSANLTQEEYDKLEAWINSL